MPKIYLSPSTQEYNITVLGDTEEYYMNLIADAMEPYLTASGIEYVRNTPEMTAASSIKASNAGNYDFHFSIHSNAAPDALAGQLTGTDAYYYPGSLDGKRMADLVVKNMQAIYPEPDKVRALTSTEIGEVSKTKAPSVLVELAYHDNYNDAVWIRDNIDSIAAALVMAITEYFGVPFVTPTQIRQGVVNISSGRLNIRSAPNISAPIVATAGQGESLTILGDYLEWYVVNYNGVDGYAYSAYISVL